MAGLAVRVNLLRHCPNLPNDALDGYLREAGKEGWRSAPLVFQVVSVTITTVSYIEQQSKLLSVFLFLEFLHIVL